MLHLMFPTHLATGYLLSVYGKLPIAYVVLGSALPDLVDRPLYWLGLTPYTHAVTHSIAVAVPACLVAIAVFGHRGAALAVGWLVHVGTDFLNVLLTQGLSQTPYFVLYAAPPSDPAPVFTTVTIPLPATDAAHTLHPFVLLVEGAIVYWTLVLLRRDGTVPDRIRALRSETDPE